MESRVCIGLREEYRRNADSNRRRMPGRCRAPQRVVCLSVAEGLSLRVPQECEGVGIL